MGFFDLLNHVLNFLAPAAWMAVAMSLAPRIFKGNRPLKPSVRAMAAINFIVSVAALLLGLIVFGRDGKMASYLAMVVLCATSQWWMLRGGLFTKKKK
jgi:heme A synthase